MYNKTKTIFKNIITHQLYDDRREYDVEDLMSAYLLNKKEARSLYKLLHKGGKN